MAMRVFVVDDDDHYVRLITYRLRKRDDLRVEIFKNGETAVEKLDPPPDLILLDIMMPGIGGLETLRRIQDRYPELPVLIVSAQGSHTVAAEAVQMGAYDYVTKGFDDFLRLGIVLRNVEERKRLREEIRALRKRA